MQKLNSQQFLSSRYKNLPSGVNPNIYVIDFHVLTTRTPLVNTSAGASEL